MAVAVMVVLPELLDLNVSEAGFALMLKFATVTVNATVWVPPPPYVESVRV
jgi:hypothetical protein